MQGNQPRACRLGAIGAGAEQKWRTGDATRRDGPAGGYAGVPAVFQPDTCVSGGGSARKQGNPEGVGIANQSSSIVSSQGSTTSSSSYPSLIAQPTTITTGHRVEYPSAILHPLQSPGKLLCHPRNLITVELFSLPILFVAGIHFPPNLLHNQDYPKVCPDPLNLPNAGDPLCRNIVIIFLFSIFPDQGLNCSDLESSRVFSVKFLEPSLFQISELLHSMKIHKKFIKVQNQFCLNP
jgi:hypothetical protein